MSIATPISRATRETEIVTATAGQTVFNVTAFKIWDTVDLRVERRLSGGRWTALASGFTVAKTDPAAHFSTATVTLGTGAAAGTKFRFSAARTHERLQDVTAGGVISSATLEREFDRLATIQQEVRRDLDDRPGLDPEGLTIDMRGARLVNVGAAVDDDDAITKSAISAAISDASDELLATATGAAATATAQAGIATAQAGIATTQAGTSTTQAGVATSAATNAMAAAAAYGLYEVTSFAELATKFVYSSPGPGQVAVAANAIILWRETGYRYKVQNSAGTGHLDYSGSGGVKMNVILGLDGCYNVRAFGAVGSGSVDDRAAIQKAFDAAKPAWSLLTSVTGAAITDTAPTVLFPPGRYRCDNKIVAWSKVGIRGCGYGTIVELGSAATDNVLFELTGISTQPTYYFVSRIETLVVDTPKTTDCSAFKPAATVTIFIGGLFLGVCVNRFRRGIDAYPAYAQNLRIMQTLSEGGNEQIIRLTGNSNLVDGVERGSPGINVPTNGLPWLLITRHNGNGGAAEGGAIGGLANPGFNRVFNLLPQQTMSGLQTVARFESCDNVVVGLGWEEVTNELRVLDFVECQSARVLNMNSNTPKAAKFRIENSSVTFEKLQLSGTPAQSVFSWHDMFTIVGTCHVHVEEIDEYLADAIIKTHDPVFSIGRIIRQNRIQAPVNGAAPYTNMALSRPAGNWFVNGDFRYGTFGWNVNPGGTLTLTPSTSKIKPSGALAITGNGAGTFAIRQRVTITSDMVGQPFTVSMTAEQTGGSAGAFGIYASGAGVTTNNSYSKVAAQKGMQTLAHTVVPLAAGTLDLGAYIVNPTSGETYWLEELCLQVGTDHAPQSNIIGSITFMQASSVGVLSLGPGILPGVGTPEGVVTAGVGTLYLRTDGSGGSTLYVKESGTGNTGWVAK